ncbi:MAG: DMT family transporter [Chloroflexi bacterium]|nr:DMT family transporter [Chloroflexota bacterium]
MSITKNAMIGGAFGIGAALAYGISSILIKQGVTRLAPPLVGAIIALSSGTIALSIVGVRGFGARLAQSKNPIVFMVLSGIANSLGAVASYFALSMTPVVIVSPLQSTHPLFILLWSHLFLGKLERITPRLILGTILVVGGVVLITIGRIE